MPYPGPFYFSHIPDFICELCPLPDPYVDRSVLGRDFEHTSLHFGLCGRKFVMCLFGVKVLASYYAIAGKTQELATWY